MSSFNINGPSSNQPMVQSSQNLGKDGGGGGNTGYMNMRKRKKNGNSNENDDNSVFLEEEIEDSFVRQSDKKEEKKSGKILGAISKFIKGKNPAKEPVKDSFVKQNNEEKLKHEEETEAEEDFSAYNVPLNKTVDPLEDDEYEVVEDDYYDDIDV